MRRLALILLTLTLLLGPTHLRGDPMERPIRYTVSFPDAPHHYVAVEAAIPAEGDTLELAMAVWTPGSYLVREYARHVEDLSAATPEGEPLEATKTAKNRWRLETGGADEVTLTYRLYCREMTVRTNFVDGSFAILNGAPTFITRADALDGAPVPHEVTVVPRPGWSRVISPLPETGSGEHPTFRAPDFDAVVDSPLYAGNATVHTFTVDGAEHRLVNEGEGPLWDGPRSAADVERIVREHLDFWGTRPYEGYTFFNLITEARGGLEHKSSSVLMTSRHATRTRERYRSWLGLVSHEFFHTWNVKRLRPAALGPFDYEDEVYTRSLWAAEGITSYYDDLLVHRAGLIDREEYLESLSERIERLQTTPGRKVQPLARASFDAWIKQYRRDENFVNTAISYYTKGLVVAFLLDAEIRRATDGRHSLDEVMRRAWGEFSDEEGFQPEELSALASEVAGADLSAFFERALETTRELDYRPALDFYGLRFTTDPDEDEGEEDEESEEGEEDELPAGWLGAEARVRKHRLTVTEVRRGTPAYEAGLQVDDEILAVGDHRVPPTGLRKLLKAYRPGEEVSILVARRERLTRVPVTLGEEPDHAWHLRPDPQATPEQRARLDAWLAGPGGE